VLGLCVVCMMFLNTSSNEPGAMVTIDPVQTIFVAFMSSLIIAPSTFIFAFAFDFSSKQSRIQHELKAYYGNPNIPRLEQGMPASSPTLLEDKPSPSPSSRASHTSSLPALPSSPMATFADRPPTSNTTLGAPPTAAGLPPPPVRSGPGAGPLRALPSLPSLPSRPELSRLPPVGARAGRLPPVALPPMKGGALPPLPLGSRPQPKAGTPGSSRSGSRQGKVTPLSRSAAPSRQKITAWGSSVPRDAGSGDLNTASIVPRGSGSGMPSTAGTDSTVPPSRGGVLASAGSDKGERYEDHRAALVGLYTKRDPAKLRTVDETLAKYQGKEAELWVKLDRKYGKDAVPPQFMIEEQKQKEKEEENAEPVRTSCFGLIRESPASRQKRLEEEAATIKEESFLVRYMNYFFGGPVPQGEVPTQYPWLIITYMGAHFWCICCAYILLLYGIQFEESTGHAWLAYAMMSLFMDIFINEPAYLFVVAVMLSAWQLYNRKNIRSMGYD